VTVPADALSQIQVFKLDFNDVPVEEDTQILSSTRMRLAGLDVLKQEWTWDGIRAESMIFKSADVASKDVEELKVVLALESGSPVAIKRTKHGYTFVNYGFKL